MKVAQQVELSLTKQRIEKLLICLGRSEDSLRGAPTRGSVAALVSQRLLLHCNPATSDIHNPDSTRAAARDRHGRPRTFYAAHDKEVRRSNRRGRTESLRTPQTWDSSRVVDYMGVWCDRLLLGDARQPARCAVLEPRVPPVLWGESVARVAQSHRHLSGKDVLLISAAETLPIGMARLQVNDASWLEEHVGSAPSLPSSLSVHALPGTTSMQHAMRLFARPMHAPSCLRIGVGSERGMQAPLTSAELRLMQQLLVPVCCFTAALWTVNPAKAAEYVSTTTAASSTLTDATANHRLWCTMQAAMLSTRDTALLHAYFHGDVLDARLSDDQVRYLAETLLQRLRDKEEGQ